MCTVSAVAKLLVFVRARAMPGEADIVFSLYMYLSVQTLENSRSAVEVTWYEYVIWQI